VRFVVYGLGAIGGVVAGHLARAGADVAGIARGAHLAKIRADGLRLVTPAGEDTVRFAVADDPAGLDPPVGADDVVLLAVKSQDTAGTLAALTAAAPAPAARPAVACFQNGVANEAVAAETFGRVYGAVVMCPSSHLEPGVVVAHAGPVPGLFDVGRYPEGIDDVAEALVAGLNQAGFDARVVPDVMCWKYRKLLLNVGNAVEALTGADARDDRLAALARREAEACLRAAGIAYASEAEDQARRVRLVIPETGPEHRGSSTWQSLARGTGSAEADWLNGEIVRIGRRAGVPTPVNAVLVELVDDLAARGGAPGSVPEEEIVARLRREGVEA
jgi:2-dehydropantoate 2-reductase